MKNKRILFLVTGLFITISMQAQEKRPLTLSEAIDLSVKNSHQLKNSQAKIEEATAALKEAVQKKLPDVGVSGSYLRLGAANFDLKTKSNNNGGGTTNETPKVNQAMYGILNASLPIYSGGRIRYGIESSEFLEKAAKLDAEDDKDEVIQTAIEAFATLFKAKSAVRLVKENLAQSQQRAKDLANLEKNGLLARNDLLKAELQSSNIELSLLDAENNLQLANVNMDLMLGLPATTELVLDTNGIAKKDDPRVLDDYLQLALGNRKDVTALDYRKKAAEAGVKSAGSSKYPSLSLTGGYIAADVPHVFTVTNAINIGVGVSYNIASLWKNKAKVQQAEARVKQIVATQVTADDDVRLQVNKNYFSLLSSRKKIEVYAKAVEQAKENYRIVKNKFDNSLATTTELLEADVAQLQATLSYTLARADAFVAYHKLLQTSGVLTTEFKK
ncbi:MAG TPA: TolC family protein [Chitinophagaceae bacterium]|jgi:outer membrane protein TolC|nr:TolC family protein [Chitinophagaceae bacterium]